jgi:hypothetical protein
MKLLKTIKSILGNAWAILCLVIVLATFVGLNFWARVLANGTGIQVAPRYSGGEVKLSTDHVTYRTLVHRPVFDGLLSERRSGFVQIDWVPKEKQVLPALIEEDFDVDHDGSIDFSVRLDAAAARADLNKKKEWVLSADNVIGIDGEMILRVQLHNPRK